MLFYFINGHKIRQLNEIRYKVKGVSDYDKEKAKYSNDEEEVYQDNIDLLEKGYIKIRPPKKREKLGCWTWSLDKFNNEKDRILISKTRTGWSVVKKEYVDSEKVIKEGNTYYFLKEKMTNLKSVVDFSTSQGTTALRNVLHTSSFNNPKNTEMLKYLISSYYKQDNLIVLDFFAGSGSTGQAVLELNKEDGGNRKFILCTNNEVGEKSEEEFNKRFGNKKKNSKEWQDWEETNGICRIVTYPRIKGVIEGYKTVKGKVAEGVPANLKYYRIKY